jgi:hypothetical protein
MKDSAQLHGFPGDLARQVSSIWTTYIGGDYIRPPLPDEMRLRSLLEVAYLAGMETEEARPLKFTLCCTPKLEVVHRYGQDSFVEAWPFATDRPFSVQEIRRIVVATDIDTSAIWVRFSENPDEPLSIHGLLNLGSSWTNARNAFSYHYDSLPEALLVRVQAPGHLIVYQGEYSIASLQAGKLQVGVLPLTTMDLFGAYSLFREGHNFLRSQIASPKHEPLREWREVEWLAYVNTILAVVNTIQIGGHGGALILVGMNSDIVRDELVKIKYKLLPLYNHLRRHFIEFMSLRHRVGDMVYLAETKDEGAPSEQELNFTECLLKDAQRRLAETCSFVGNLSGTDGALILRADLSVEGFGAEILLDKVKRAKVYKVSDPLEGDIEELDSDQFGMRHRSAMRLCSTVSDIVAFVVSQDGGVSLVWNDRGEVCFKPGIKTTNVNMFLA